MLFAQHYNFIEKIINTYTLFFQLSIVVLFLISLFGLLIIRRDLVTVLIATELMFLNSVLILLPFCYITGGVESEIFILFILVVAAAETAVTFAILSNFFSKNVFNL
jgi:NADH-quinone oxidoreductase subunit K